MTSIEQLSKEFIDKSKEDLKEYCERQYKEIVKLLSINKKLEDEVEHLKKLLVNGTQIIQSPVNITNEELVCLKQIEDLKYLSDKETLTLEEAKKLDLYVKTLQLIRSKAKDPKEILKDINTEDLLKVVEDEIK